MACFAFSTPAHAAQTIPYRINFQGRVTNASGTTLANGTYNMKFRIYNAASGGTLQWSEDRLVASSQGVVVTGGLFSVQLDEVSNTMTPALFTNQNLYLEVELPTLATATSSSPSWTEGAMSRAKLGSAAYAFNSDTLDGLDSAAFSQLSTANAFTNTNSITTSNASALVVNSGAANIFSVDTTSAGKVTIGTVDANGTVLVLDSNASDPTGTTGGMYYNSGSAKFRCYYASAWADCSPTLSLNNLTTTSINQSLTSNATNTLDLGTSSVKWRTGYFATSLVSPAVRPVADSATAFQIQNAAGSSVYLNLNTTSGAIEIGSSTLAGKLAISDGSSNFATLTVGALAGNYTVNIPTITANDTMCLLTNANCTTNLQTAYNISTGGTTPEIKVSSTKGALTIQDADTTIAGTLFSVNQSNASGIGTAIFSIDSTGAVSLGLASTTTTLPGNISSTGTFSATGATALFKPSSSAANAFQIQDSASLVFFSADTSAKVVRIGSSSTADTTVLLVQDYGSADPTGVNGGSYYNSTNNKFRCYQNSIWQDCGNGFNTVTKTADQIATQSSTTFQDDNTLFFTANANTTYTFDAWIPVNDSNATVDLKYTFTAPTSSTITVMTSYFGATPATQQVLCNITTSGQTCANTTVNNAGHFIQVRGYVAVAGTAGQVRFRFAQNTASAVNFPIVKKGATLSWHQSN